MSTGVSPHYLVECKSPQELQRLAVEKPTLESSPSACAADPGLLSGAASSDPGHPSPAPAWPYGSHSFPLEVRHIIRAGPHVQGQRSFCGVRLPARSSLKCQGSSQAWWRHPTLRRLEPIKVGKLRPKALKGRYSGRAEDGLTRD